MHQPRVVTCLFLLGLVHATAARAEPLPPAELTFGTPNAPVEPIVLDALPRQLPEGQKFACPTVDKARYAGTLMKISPAALVNDEFAKRLALFEAVVRDVAVEVYGRAPRKIKSLGTYNCRPIRLYPGWISEHGLANAIDVAAFEFAPATKAERKLAVSPDVPRRAFVVSVEKHWQGGRGNRDLAALHRLFLLSLTDALVKRPDIFRVILGPGYPGHANHFHFDLSPYRMVEVVP